MNYFVTNSLHVLQGFTKHVDASTVHDIHTGNIKMNCYKQWMCTLADGGLEIANISNTADFASHAKLSLSTKTRCYSLLIPCTQRRLTLYNLRWSTYDKNVQ